MEPAFFHRRTAVFYCFQLEIETNACTHSRKTPCYRPAHTYPLHVHGQCDQIEPFIDTFWAIFGEIGQLFIPSTGHTVHGRINRYSNGLGPPLST